jgi:predicted phage terminase large subunit-like protein
MIGKDQSLRFIYGSYSGRLGVRANLKVQRAIDSEKYGKVFPESKIGKSGHNESSSLQRTKEFIEFGEGGSFRNTTIGGSVTGETLDIGIIDDPIKGRAEANSPTIRDKTWDWFTDDFSTRFDEHAGLIIILTRWHIDDPVGRLLAKKNTKVKLLSYPAIAEVSCINRQVGDPLFPEHKSLEFLMEKKASMPEANWSSLYQQNPIIAGGNLFRMEWWRFYTGHTKIKYRVMYADTALKAQEEHDFTVFQVWGLGYDGDIYLLDQLRGKWEAPELLVQAKAFWKKHKAIPKGTLRAMKVEDKASGTGLIQTLRKDTQIPIQAIQRSTDKISRANDALPFIESGYVHLPEDAPWLSDYLLEFSQFPNAVHDDQVDPTMDAITDLLQETEIDYSNLV